MSLEIYAMCAEVQTDTIELEKVINELGFQLKFRSHRVLNDTNGFLPAEWRGLEAGFECSPIEFSELSETYDDFDLAGPWPHVYAMYFSTLRGCVGAWIAAAAIVTRSNGAVFDPQYGNLLRGTAVVETATRTEIDYLAIEASQIRKS